MPFVPSLSSSTSDRSRSTFANLARKGKTKHQLTIQAGVRPSGVLSEGEQRVVAIAAFLAELSTSTAQSPIVFDDPVSSLDRIFSVNEWQSDSSQNPRVGRLSSSRTISLCSSH